MAGMQTTQAQVLEGEVDQRIARLAGIATTPVRHTDPVTHLGLASGDVLERHAANQLATGRFGDDEAGRRTTGPILRAAFDPLLRQFFRIRVGNAAGDIGNTKIPRQALHLGGILRLRRAQRQTLRFDAMLIHLRLLS